MRVVHSKCGADVKLKNIDERVYGRSLKSKSLKAFGVDVHEFDLVGYCPVCKSFVNGFNMTIMWSVPPKRGYP